MEKLIQQASCIKLYKVYNSVSENKSKWLKTYKEPHSVTEMQDKVKYHYYVDLQSEKNI